MNYIADDCISRKDVVELIEGWWLGHTREDDLSTEVQKLPSVYPKSKEFQWCKDCKEYDQEKHCCHRYSSVIRTMLTDNINAVLDDIKTEIQEEKEFAYADFERYKVECLGVDADDLPDDDFRYGLERSLEILYKYKKQIRRTENG